MKKNDLPIPDLTKSAQQPNHDGESPEAEYERVLASGDAEALFELGLRYDDAGLGKPDFDKAIPLYERASGLDHVLASFNLGVIFADGKAGHKDVHKAKLFYERAARLGDADGWFNLGCMYRNGEFGAPDFERAKIHFEKAEAQGHNGAMNNLAILHQQKRFQGATLETAVELYARASDSGNALAAFNLARLYQTHKCAEGTRDRIQELFRLADSGGYTNAATYLTNPMIKAVLDRLGSSGIDTVLRANIEQALDTLEETFFKIRKEHLIKGSVRLAHFTTWPAIESIMTLKAVDRPQNCLRLYHVEYMNDPSEGQRLLSFKAKGDDPKVVAAVRTSRDLKALFEEHYFSSFVKHDSTQTLLPSVFTVSLTQEADRLDLWRAYGRDGAGYCLVLPVEQEADGSSFVRNRTASLGFLSDVSEKETGPNDKLDLPCLYWIQYDDEKVVDALTKIAAPLATVLRLKEQVSPGAWKQIASCATAILLELLYLYKDEQYSTEKEARALSVMRLDHPRVQPDERTPGRLYCETSPFLFQTAGSEVILGPKVQDSTAAMWNIRYRLGKLGLGSNTIVRKSDVPYR